MLKNIYIALTTPPHRLSGSISHGHSLASKGANDGQFEGTFVLPVKEVMSEVYAIKMEQVTTDNKLSPSYHLQ